MNQDSGKNPLPEDGIVEGGRKDTHGERAAGRGATQGDRTPHFARGARVRRKVMGVPQVGQSMACGVDVGADGSSSADVGGGSDGR